MLLVLISDVSIMDYDGRVRLEVAEGSFQILDHALVSNDGTLHVGARDVPAFLRPCKTLDVLDETGGTGISSKVAV